MFNGKSQLERYLDIARKSQSGSLRSNNISHNIHNTVLNRKKNVTKVPNGPDKILQVTLSFYIKQSSYLPVGVTNQN